MREYNGHPLYEVGLEDFTTVTEAVTGKRRLLSRNIKDDNLREYFINTRKPCFGVAYNDVIVLYGGRN